MCNPASFVLTKDRVFWSKKTNRHSDIIEEFDLHSAGVRGANTVSVELSPKDWQYDLPIDSWLFRTDQAEIDLPDWYNAADAEQRVRAELPEWRKYHCVVVSNQVNAATQSSGDNVAQVACYAATQSAGTAAAQFAGSKATQTAGRSAIQYASVHSVQLADEASYQISSSCSKQFGKANARQFSVSNAMQVALCGAVQHSRDFAIQTAEENSTQITGNSSFQRAGINTVQITRWNNAEPYNGKIATRVVNALQANKWYFVQNGVWRECTEKELADLDRRLNGSNEQVPE